MVPKVGVAGDGGVPLSWHPPPPSQTLPPSKRTAIKTSSLSLRSGLSGTYFLSILGSFWGPFGGPRALLFELIFPTFFGLHFYTTFISKMSLKGEFHGGGGLPLTRKPLSPPRTLPLLLAPTVFFDFQPLATLGAFGNLGPVEAKPEPESPERSERLEVFDNSGTLTRGEGVPESP